MHNDIRDRNQYFKSDQIFSYLREYAGAISYALNRVDEEALEAAKTILLKTRSLHGRIFVAGNGGSASISDHLCCDFVKGTFSDKTNALDVTSLLGSTALFTAIGNDLGYEKTFSFQLEAFQLKSHDAVILISSSGNSQNIIEAALFAQSRRASVIGLTGFDGGQLIKLSDAKLHVPANNYGVIEDSHQAIMHILAQFIYLSFK